MKFLLKTLLTAIAVAIASNLIPGIAPYGAEPWLAFLMASLSLGFVNALIKPVVTLISIPATIVTLGIFQLVVNTFMFELASWISVHVIGAGIIISSFGSAFIAAIVVSFISGILNSLANPSRSLR
ncbi:phage holin family protein [Collinsella sp. zg1085]|uniref:phage holin family protein n=1 Tax=Collinsella sp. zg1085 TaxID=2844380 RepID=UPI001C0AC335|nr:phage holin family protein [Collinsella sp. zg1085]QWT17899.1 phage holin family protein [Collinsella sp. zg1085]